MKTPGHSLAISENAAAVTLQDRSSYIQIQSVGTNVATLGNVFDMLPAKKHVAGAYNIPTGALVLDLRGTGNTETRMSITGQERGRVEFHHISDPPANCSPQKDT